MLKAKKGLTLVEVLITAALMTVTMIPLNLLLRTVVNSSQTIPNAIQLNREIRVSCDFITALIKNADNFDLVDVDSDNIGDELFLYQGSETYKIYNNNGQLTLVKNGTTSEILAMNCQGVEFYNPGARGLILFRLFLENGRTVGEINAVAKRLAS